MDEYLGSGKFILNKIRENGKASLVRSNLVYCDSKVDAAIIERFLISSARFMSISILNIHEGGLGGFEHINSSGIQQTEEFRNIQRALGKQSWNNKSDRMTPQNWVSYSYAEHSQKMRESNPASVGVIAVSPNGEVTYYESVISCVRTLGVGRTRLLKYLKEGTTNHGNSKWAGWYFKRAAEN